MHRLLLPWASATCGFNFEFLHISSFSHAEINFGVVVFVFVPFDENFADVRSDVLLFKKFVMTKVSW